MNDPIKNAWPHPPQLGLHFSTEIHFIRCNSVAISKKVWKCRTNCTCHLVSLPLWSNNQICSSWKTDMNKAGPSQTQMKKTILCMAVHNYIHTSPPLSRKIRGAIDRWRVLKNMWEINENKEKSVCIKQELQGLKLEHLALCWLRDLAGDTSCRKSGVSICNNKKK